MENAVQNGIEVILSSGVVSITKNEVFIIKTKDIKEYK